MVRVLHITRDFPPRVRGGISTAVGGMMRACARARIADCAAISFDDWRPRRASQRTSRAAGAAGDGVEGHEGRENRPGPVFRVSAPDQLALAHSFATGFAPDVLHVHHGMLWSFADQLRDHLRIPAIFSVHVLQRAQNRVRGIDSSVTTLSLTAQEQALSRSDIVIAPSRAAASGLLGDYPELCSRVRVVGLGGDDTALTRAAAAREKPGGPILYAGRFADINGTAELFAAIPRVLERVPGAEFAIAGGVPDNPKAESRWHRRWRDHTTAEVKARVRFLGWLSERELAAWYARAGALVSPSWFETFGLVVLEAMMHGLPIAATRSGGVEELLEHEITGLLSPPRDIDAMVEHLVRISTSPDMALRLGQRAAIRARERHSWSRVVPALCEVYAAVGTTA